MQYEVIVNLINQLKMYYKIYEKEILKIKIEINIELERKSELEFILVSDAEDILKTKIELYLKSGANIDKTIEFLHKQIEECHQKFQNEIFELKAYLSHLKHIKEYTDLTDPGIGIKNGVKDKNFYEYEYQYDNDDEYKYDDDDEYKYDDDDEYQYDDENKYKY